MPNQMVVDLAECSSLEILDVIKEWKAEGHVMVNEGRLLTDAIEMINRPTPSWVAKMSGIDSLTTVTRLTGVSQQTLHNWKKNKPDLFDIVIEGCASRLGSSSQIQRETTQAQQTK